jgi:hypothetical protein
MLLFLIYGRDIVLAEKIVERFGHEVLQRRIIRPFRLYKSDALFEILVEPRRNIGLFGPARRLPCPAGYRCRLGGGL